jgi:stage II sporulation protein AA (anti-sigma F factor antagonist)
MKFSTARNGGQLLMKLDGELDHHAAKKAIREIGDAIDINLPKSCVLDMSGVTFMDSSGIAVILGVYKKMGELGGRMSVENLPSQAKRVLKAAGVNKIVALS